MTTHRLHTSPLDYGDHAFRVNGEIRVEGFTRRIAGRPYRIDGSAVIVTYVERGERVTRVAMTGTILAKNPIPTPPAVHIAIGDMIDLGDLGEWLLAPSGNVNQPYTFEKVTEHECSADIGFNAGCGDVATNQIDGEWYCDVHGDRYAYDHD